MYRDCNVLDVLAVKTRSGAVHDSPYLFQLRSSEVWCFCAWNGKCFVHDSKSGQDLVTDFSVQLAKHTHAHDVTHAIRGLKDPALNMSVSVATLSHIECRCTFCCVSSSHTCRGTGLADEHSA